MSTPEIAQLPPPPSVVYVENAVNVELVRAVVELLKSHTAHIETLLRASMAADLNAWDKAEVSSARTARILNPPDRPVSEAKPREPDLMPEGLG